jgi:arginase family enzyme
VHVLYVDGDFDDAAPDPGRCQSAAALAVWLLTHGAPFWAGPPLTPAQVTVVGWSAPSQSRQPGMGSLSLAEVRRVGPREAARQALAGVAASAGIVLHLDVDVFGRRDVPAAYFPHAEGLSLAEGRELLGVLLRDPRVRVVEVAEYAALRDLDQRSAGALVDLLVESLRA